MNRAAPRFFRLCAEEPFRIFFPLGLLFGLIGVSLWPLFFAGAIRIWPALAHARLMIEGMMSCFIFGFLGTAGPRVMSVPHFTIAEVVRLIVLLSVAMLVHLGAWHALADTVFVVALLLFAIALGRRFVRREDSPPPNFALVGLGLLNAIIGAALIVFSEWTNSAFGLFRIGSSFLNIGFVLLPLLGVAPFFMRRLLDLPTDAAAERNLGAKAALALATGIIIDLSLIAESSNANAVLGWTRCAVAAIYLVLTMPLAGPSALATALRMSLVTIPAALGLVAFLPAYRISALHVLFIGAFSLAGFSVATRVVLGHGDRLGLLQQRRGFMPTVVVLLILAMISRFSADFVPMRTEHLVGAAVAWLLAALLWAALVLPHVMRFEDE